MTSIQCLGIDLSEQASGKTVAGDAADLRNGYRSPATLSALVEQPFTLTMSFQRRMTNRASWHGVTLAS